MKLSNFNQFALTFYKARKSVYLRSAPGRGKTTSVLAAVPYMAQALNKHLGVSIVNGPNLTPGDTIGFGVPKHSTTADGKPISEMVFTLPFFWRTTEGKLLEEYDGGVIFIDEVDKADVDIKKVLGEMALSGRCGTHTLPPGWVVWFAGNRQGDRSGSTKELDHLINRRFEYEVEDDVQGWETWALRNNVPPEFVAFATSNPQIVWPDKLPDKQGPFCTPRSLVATGELLLTYSGNGELPTDKDALVLASGGIGEEAAAQLFATIRLANELPAMDTILNAPGSAKLPGKPDAQMLVCYKLAHLTEPDNITQIIKYVERLPADLAITYAKAAITRRPMLAAHPAIIDWSKRHGGLLALVAQMGK